MRGRSVVLSDTYRGTIYQSVLTRLVYTVTMQPKRDGVREMLLGIQLSLLGYIFESFRLAPEEVNGLLLVGGTVLTVGGFVAGHGQ